jgi:hypothetical protein
MCNTPSGAETFATEGITTMTNKKDVPETARDVPTVEVTVEYLVD